VVVASEAFPSDFPPIAQTLVDNQITGFVHLLLRATMHSKEMRLSFQPGTNLSATPFVQ
jgi:hypothetical protein